MFEFIKSLNIDWYQVFTFVCTVIIIPLGVQLFNWLKEKNKGFKYEKYTNQLLDSAKSVVKDVYQTVVESIKGGDEWTEEKKAEVLEIAKTKLLASLSSEGYKFLKTVNSDFDEWIIVQIESAIFDMKREAKNK